MTRIERCLGLERIVAKRTDLPYRTGRSRRWLTIKNLAHPSSSRVREAFSEPQRHRRAMRD
jgi:ATP-dependent DNA ligase